MDKTGGTTQSFVEMDTYLKAVFGKSSSDTLSVAELESLNSYMKTLLKE